MEATWTAANGAGEDASAGALRQLWDGAWSLTSVNWSAIGTWAAVGVAVVAAILALRQVREARLTRDEQAQPNVVMFTEPVKGSWQFLDIVIKNYGQTPAFDVTIELDSKPQVSPDPGETEIGEVAIPDTIPVLAPGQEWRGLWDFAPEHFKTDGIKNKHTGLVKYRGQRKKRQSFFSAHKEYAWHETPVTLDFKLLSNSRRVTIKTIDDVADTLADELAKTNRRLQTIADTLVGYSANEHRGLWVYNVDPELERQNRQQERDAEKQSQAEARRIGEEILNRADPSHRASESPNTDDPS